MIASHKLPRRWKIIQSINWKPLSDLQDPVKKQIMEYYYLCVKFTVLAGYLCPHITERRQPRHTQFPFCLITLFVTEDICSHCKLSLYIEYYETFFGHEEVICRQSISQRISCHQNSFPSLLSILINMSVLFSFYPLNYELGLETIVVPEKNHSFV